MHKVVVGIFSNPDSAALAAHEFLSRGYSPQEVSVIPATDELNPLVPEIMEVTVKPTTARGFGIIPMVSAFVGAILGFLFWQVMPASYGHLIVHGGVLGFLYGAAVGVVLEHLFGDALINYRRHRAQLELDPQPLDLRTMVAVHTEEKDQTKEAQNLLELSGASEISTKAA
jgi:hypothetical protein